MSAGRFGVIRPYEDWMREKVFACPDSVGYSLGEGWVVPTGTSDDEAVGLGRANSDAPLLLPYNMHRTVDDGPCVDGVGVALPLSEKFVERGMPVVMPTTDFSMGVSSDRRFAELRERRPEVADGSSCCPSRKSVRPRFSNRSRRSPPADRTDPSRKLSIHFAGADG